MAKNENKKIISLDNLGVAIQTLFNKVVAVTKKQNFDETKRTTGKNNIGIYVGEGTPSTEITADAKDGDIYVMIEN